MKACFKCGLLVPPNALVTAILTATNKETKAQHHKQVLICKACHKGMKKK